MIDIRQAYATDLGNIRGFLGDHGMLSPVALGVLQHSDLVVWLAYDAATLVGVILTRPLQFADGTIRGGIDEIVITERMRNRGIGRQLVQMAETHYQAQGAIGMQLGVRAENAPARHLYDSLGYVEVEQRIRMLKDF